MDDGKSLFYAVFSLILFSVGAVIGSVSGGSAVRDEAVRYGVAKYTVDQKTGKVKFAWVTEKGGD